MRVVELSSSSTTSERDRRKSLKDRKPSDFSLNDGSIRFICAFTAELCSQSTSSLRDRLGDAGEQPHHRAGRRPLRRRRLHRQQHLARPDLFDVRAVDVLRGPQGALYGQSSTGGAILIGTNQPDLNAYGVAGDVSFGNYNLHRERLEANLPLSNTVALRISGQKYDHTGFTADDAIPGYRLDDAHDESGKVALLWQPSSGFKATLTAQIYHADQHGDARRTSTIRKAVPGRSTRTIRRTSN